MTHKKYASRGNTANTFSQLTARQMHACKHYTKQLDVIAESSVNSSYTNYKALVNFENLVTLFVCLFYLDIWLQ